MDDTGKTTFLSVLAAAGRDETARITRQVHMRLRLHEPTIEEIAGYRKAISPGHLEALIIQKCAESLLYLRTKPLKPGQLKAERRDFQKEVESALCRNASLKDKRHQKEFEMLALSFSRLFALYYVDEEGRQPYRVEGRLETLLPHLAQHLLAEMELCMEARFTNAKNNLCKVSVFDIQDKLDMLELHAEAVVRDNAKTIIYAALNKGNLELADRLASGAKDKLDMLELHPNQIVRKRARSILSTLLNNGNLDASGVVLNDERIVLENSV